MTLRDEMRAALTQRCHERCSSTCRDTTSVCAEVAERHYAPIEAERRELLARIAEMEAMREHIRYLSEYVTQLEDTSIDLKARITELEAELDSWRAKWYDAQRARMAAPLARPADVLVINGQQWRYDPSEAVEWGASDGTRGIDCTLEPVEDSDG